MKLAPNSPKSYPLRSLWSTERPGLEKNRACDLGNSTKFTGASPVLGPGSLVRTRRHSTESQECLPTARVKATHHHSCELVVGCAGYQCDVGMFPALELFRREKEKERRELKRLSRHLKCIGTLPGTEPGSLFAGLCREGKLCSLQ